MEIRNVYSDSLVQEMAKIREVVVRYKYIALETEFPGVVVRPVGAYVASKEKEYDTLRANVDMLNIIQIGLTFCDENGNLAPGCPCWQFNFRFNLEEDIFAEDAIQLLRRAGIDFAAHATRGIDTEVFAAGKVLRNSQRVISTFQRDRGRCTGYSMVFLMPKEPLLFHSSNTRS